MGELTGKLEIDERGTIETPVYLCGSHAVGTVHHAAVARLGPGARRRRPARWWASATTGRGRIRATVVGGDVERALESLGAEVAEGTVGAGTGMSCFGFPGGIGTASRAVGAHHVGVLLLCNFGDREYLDLLGTNLEPQAGESPSPTAPASRSAPPTRRSPPSSCAAWRCGPCSGSPGPAPTRPTDLARSASPSRPPSRPAIATGSSTPYFAAAFEAAHEAVYNCLVAGPAGRAARRDDAGCVPDRGGQAPRPCPRSAILTSARRSSGWPAR